MSNLTKRALAASMKKLLTQKKLDAITIQNIVDDAEVSRKTFYYHFQDIYDLLEWIFVDEGKRVLAGNTSVGTWQQGLKNVFDYLQDNRAMVLNAYRSLQKDRDFVREQVSQLVRPLFERFFDAQPSHERIDEEDRQFILDLYSSSIVELVHRWIANNMKPEADHLLRQINRFFNGSMGSLIQRYIHEQE